MAEVTKSLIREMDAQELKEHYMEIHRRNNGNLSSLSFEEYEEMKECCRNYLAMTGKPLNSIIN